MKWRVLLALIVCFSLLLFLGGVGFQYLEQEHEQEEILAYKQYLEEFLDEQPCMSTHKLSELVKRVVRAYDQGVLHPVSAAPYTTNWDLPGSVFFAGAVATTIGYGNITPTTYGGRMFCVFFGVVSIPLCLVMLAAIGRKIRKAINILDSKMEPWKKRRRWIDRSFQAALITSCGVVVFMIVPALLFMVLEDWEYRDAMYYTFITLTTIGFGDFVAGSNPELAYHSLYRLMTWLWIILGLAWLSTIISMVQDIVQNFVKKVDKKVTKDKESRIVTSEQEEYKEDISLTKNFQGFSIVQLSDSGHTGKAQ